MNVDENNVKLSQSDSTNESGLVEEPDEQASSVGQRLQQIRRFKGLSQRELARRADMTNSTLSMIEQGKVSPTVSSLERILNAFPLSLQEFFSESMELSPAVIYAEDFVQMKKGGSLHKIMPMLNAKIEGVYLSSQLYPPFTEVKSEWMINNGFIGGIVTQGQIDLRLDGVKYNLSEGDGFHFSLNRDHSFNNAGPDDCMIVAVSFSE